MLRWARNELARYQAKKRLAVALAELGFVTSFRPIGGRIRVETGPPWEPNRFTSTLTTGELVSISWRPR